jgi:hypothetical protein
VVTFAPDEIQELPSTLLRQQSVRHVKPTIHGRNVPVLWQDHLSQVMVSHSIAKFGPEGFDSLPIQGLLRPSFDLQHEFCALRAWHLSRTGPQLRLNVGNEREVEAPMPSGLQLHQEPLPPRRLPTIEFVKNQIPLPVNDQTVLVSLVASRAV